MSSRAKITTSIETTRPVMPVPKQRETISFFFFFFWIAPMSTDDVTTSNSISYQRGWCHFSREQQRQCEQWTQEWQEAKRKFEKNINKVRGKCCSIQKLSILFVFYQVEKKQSNLEVNSAGSRSEEEVLIFRAYFTGSNDHINRKYQKEEQIKNKSRRHGVGGSARIGVHSSSDRDEHEHD